MNKCSTIFRDIQKLFPDRAFDKLIAKHQTDRYSKYFKTKQQFMTLLYSQIQGLDSTREIETSLNAQKASWYHSGFKGAPKSTLSDALANRSCEVYEGLFYAMLNQCQANTPGHGFRFKNSLHSIDSSTIDLCLNIFPWAKFRKRKGAIKLHALLNHSGMLPEFISITEGNVHDVKAVQMPEGINNALLPDSIITFDKAYIDFKWLYSLHKRGIYFVTRCKNNMDYHYTGQHKDIVKKCILRDDIIELSGQKSSTLYPEKMRLIEFYDETQNKYYEFITNILHLSAKTIADIYKSRWQIELFFKWIKQNLKIKSFLGTSKNAVMSQIWVAMCYLLLLKYIKYQTKFNRSITDLARIIRATLMERKHLIDILTMNNQMIKKARDTVIQIALF